MHILQRIYLWLIVLASGLAYWAIVQYSNKFFIVFYCYLAAVSLLFWLFLKLKFKKGDNWIFFLVFLCFCAFGPVFLIFMEIGILFYLTASAVVFVLYLFLQNLFVFIYRTEHYKINSLESVVFFMLVAVVFFAYAAAYNILVVLGQPLTSLLLIAMLANVLLVSLGFWINRLPIGKLIIPLLVINLVMIELFWSLYLVPISFYLNALIISVVYYSLIEIFKLAEREKMTRKTALQYGLFISAITLFSLSSMFF